jgi:hypothetical protein
MLQGSSKAEIVPDEAQGSSALMMSWGSGEAEIVPDRVLGLGALMTSWGSGKAKTIAQGTYLA